MKRNVLNKKLVETVSEICCSSLERDEKLLKICILLKDNFDGYDWVGFYLADNERKELVLGPFSGKPTEHLRIPFGRGICGQTAESLETFIAGDVLKESNYLSCSPDVRSEIVVPLMRGDVFLGEIDIDSHTAERFGEEDRIFLEQISSIISEII